MKLNSSVSKFLTNRWVLNIVAFLTIFNIIGYIYIGNVNAVLYFILFAVLIRYFSKNMTIVLGVPLIIINLFSLKGGMMEGMENKTDNTKVSSTTNTSTNDKNKQNTEPDTTDTVSKTKEDNSDQIKKQGFETGHRKNRGYNIDYATTVEDAYDELNNKLGGDGIQRLTADTQNLIQKQMKLAKTMEGMGKLVENIQPMVGQLQQMMGSSKEGTS